MSTLRKSRPALFSAAKPWKLLKIALVSLLRSASISHRETQWTLLICLKEARSSKARPRVNIILKILKGGWTKIGTNDRLQHSRNQQTFPGFLTRYKARPCARGDMQHTEQDTYAATLAALIFRALMAIVAAFDLEPRQYDAVNDFANSPIDEPTYYKSSVGWTGSESLLVLLLRALYGLKQSPALWYRHFSQTLSEIGLEPVAGLHCLFTNDYMLLFFFVDNIVVLFDRQYTKQLDELQAKLFDAYEMRYLGELDWFLSIRISSDIEKTRHLWLCRDSYIDQLTSKFNISIDRKTPGAPLLGACKINNLGNTPGNLRLSAAHRVDQLRCSDNPTTHCSRRFQAF